MGLFLLPGRRWSRAFHSRFDLCNSWLRDVDRVRAVGKATGILVGDAALATMWLGAGITFVACGSDLNLLARGARTLADTVRQESGLKA